MKYIYYFLLLAGLSILLFRWRKVDRRLLLFAPILFSTILTELSCDLFQTYFLYHINQVIEFSLLCTYYYLLMTESRYRGWVWVALALYVGYFISFFIRYPNQFFRFDPFDFVVEGIFITVFSLYYLVDLYRSSEEVNISRHPHFWINAGNLLFYSGAALFMALAYTLSRHYKPLYNGLGNIVKLLNLVFYSVYIKAFLCRSPEKILA